MKIEIWSDVMCPFCYIGKRHLEKALSSLPFSNNIQIVWKSYQLNPHYRNTEGEDLYTYLAKSKGISIAQAEQMTLQVEQMAKAAGLTINFEKNIPANSFDAHRLIHFAAKNGKQDEVEEALFKAHFTEGKDVADLDTLIEIAVSIGLDKVEATDVLKSNAFAEEVRYDIYESQQMSIRGVPFFVMDRKYALSGAQPVEAFTQAIVQSYTEWSASTDAITLSNLNTEKDNSCDSDGCSIT